MLHPPEVFKKRVEKPHSLNIDKILAFAAGKVYNNYMCNVGISGATGTGKSTLAIEMALRADKDFHFDTHMIYTRSEIIEKAYKLPKRSFIVVDEAIGAFKRRAMEALQKDLVEMINKIRYKNHVIVWNLPFFTDLDSAVRKHFDIWIHVVERGKAVVLVKNMNVLAEDPWLPEYWRRMWASRAMKTPSEVLRMFRAHPLYEMTIHFPPLPEKIQRVYDYYSERAKARLESEEKGQKPYLKLLKTTTPKLLETYVAATIALGALLRNRTISIQDLRDAFSKNPPSVSIQELVGGLTHNPQWWPPDANDFAKHIQKKYDQYRS